MAGWDDGTTTYVVENPLLNGAGPDEDAGSASALSPSEAKLRFRKFVREFRVGSEFVYRDQLLRNVQRREPFLEIDLGDLGSYSERLRNCARNAPLRYVPLFEDAVVEVLRGLSSASRDRHDPAEEHAAEADAATPAADAGAADGQIEAVERGGVQVLFTSRGYEANSMRNLTAADVNRLVKIPGIITSATKVRSQATRVQIRCTKCQHTMSVPSAEFSSVPLPMYCQRPRSENDGSADACEPGSYRVLPDASRYVDQQTLKLQEAPEDVPTGEMPRSLIVSVQRTLVDRVAPGTRVVVLGVQSTFNNSRASQSAMGAQVSVRVPYLSVLGLEIDVEGAGRASSTFTPEEEERFRALAASGEVYTRMATSVAPSIQGSYTDDIKKAIVCLLFSGSRKMLPDGTKLRGDINVLLLGDPSTAKSQFLKFVERVAPVGVYTSGKGSSAAGLTASVIRDARGEFYLEGGAMVLADGGVVCIDEFDKMREHDRVAIHEAMEQQTISIAKAGITTILNSRAAVLAAANPIFGRYDDDKSAGENIEFQTTILSRFDMIFIVRDLHDAARDIEIARHVMGVHLAAATATDAATSDDELDVRTMKRFVSFCRTRCAPRLSEAASTALRSEYVKIRKQVSAEYRDDPDENVIPITVRQLEAIVRIAESLAKMRLSAEANESDVEEALRLFRVSTLTASKRNDAVSGANMQQVKNVEDALRRRIAIGSKCRKATVRKELERQGYDDSAVARALHLMVKIGDMREDDGGKSITRLK